MRRSARIGAHSDGCGVATESDEGASVAGMKDGRFRRGHDAIGAGARRKGPEVVLRVDLYGAVRRHDERPDVELRSDPDRSPDDEGQGMGGRRLDERGKTWIALRESQAIGQFQLVAGQRQLGKDENLCLLFRGDVNESKVLVDVRVDTTRNRDRLSRSYRTEACHVGKLA